MRASLVDQRMKSLRKEKKRLTDELTKIDTELPKQVAYANELRMCSDRYKRALNCVSTPMAFAPSAHGIMPPNNVPSPLKGINVPPSPSPSTISVPIDQSSITSSPSAQPSAATSTSCTTADEYVLPLSSSPSTTYPHPDESSVLPAHVRRDLMADMDEDFTENETSDDKYKHEFDHDKLKDDNVDNNEADRNDSEHLDHDTMLHYIETSLDDSFCAELNEKKKKLKTKKSKNVKKMKKILEGSDKMKGVNTTDKRIRIKASVIESPKKKGVKKSDKRVKTSNKTQTKDGKTGNMVTVKTKRKKTKTNSTKQKTTDNVTGRKTKKEMTPDNITTKKTKRQMHVTDVTSKKTKKEKNVTGNSGFNRVLCEGSSSSQNCSVSFERSEDHNTQFANFALLHNFPVPK